MEAIKKPLTLLAIVGMAATAGHFLDPSMVFIGGCVFLAYLVLG